MEELMKLLEQAKSMAESLSYLRKDFDRRIVELTAKENSLAEEQDKLSIALADLVAREERLFPMEELAARKQHLEHIKNELEQDRKKVAREQLDIQAYRDREIAKIDAAKHELAHLKDLENQLQIDRINLDNEKLEYKAKLEKSFMDKIRLGV